MPRGDAAAPAALWLTLELLGMPGARLGMLIKFANQFQRFFLGLWFALQQPLEIFLGFRLEFNPITHKLLI